MWRLIYAKRKLQPSSFSKLELLLEEISYTCGTSFEDLVLPEELRNVKLLSIYRI